jgi:hypothetical protein
MQIRVAGRLAAGLSAGTIGLGLLVGNSASAQLPPAVAPAPPVTLPIGINTTPPGANIYVDSKEPGLRGQSGPDTTLRLARGRHRLFLELEGYLPLAVTVDLVQPQRLSFVLKPAPATISVSTLTPSPVLAGAEVYSDGRLAGSFPCVLEVAGGRHTIEIKRDGLLLYAEHLEVRGGESRALYVPLSPRAVIPAPAPSLPSPSLPPGLAGPVLVPVEIMPRSPRARYTVMLGSGEECRTPCSLRVPAGPTEVYVFGPGRRQFQRSIVIPPVPSRLVVQDYSLSRIILGSMFTSWSLPLVGLGLSVLDRSGGEVTGSVMLAHGVAFLGIGVGLLAAIQTNRVSVSPQLPGGLRSRSRVLSGAIAPTADRSGAVAGLVLAR